jgi:hypothetical protein
MIGSDSYFLQPMIASTTSSSNIADVEDGGMEDKCMYELVLMIVVTTESRTFLLLESAHALAHSKILRR